MTNSYDQRTDSEFEDDRDRDWEAAYTVALARFESMSDSELTEARDDEALDGPALEAINDELTDRGLSVSADPPMEHDAAADVPPNPYAVGSIWHTSWGYDQTQVEFYTVVRETAASVWLVPMTSEYRDGREFPVSAVLWIHPKMHRKGKHGTYIRMDYVRHAWPYTGGGCYSTDAAGVCGH